MRFIINLKHDYIGLNHHVKQVSYTTLVQAHDN